MSIHLLHHLVGEYMFSSKNTYKKNHIFLLLLSPAFEGVGKSDKMTLHIRVGPVKNGGRRAMQSIFTFAAFSPFPQYRLNFAQI